MASKVLLILGYGPNIGKSTASKFASQGYKIAVASRSVEVGPSKETGYYGIKADFSKPESLASLFGTVEKEVGVPNVVLYNRLLLPPSLNHYRCRTNFYQLRHSQEAYQMTPSPPQSQIIRKT
jgi:NAD(P)-dependent dehydrogenase (short-subunit alcohol dehydrogenase family)